MKLSEKIKLLNTPCKYLFKPGYPTARGVYMCLTKNQEAMFSWLHLYELSAHRLLHCGHDYNYDGDLFEISHERN